METRLFEHTHDSAYSSADLGLGALTTERGASQLLERWRCRLPRPRPGQRRVRYSPDRGRGYGRGAEWRLQHLHAYIDNYSEVRPWTEQAAAQEQAAERERAAEQAVVQQEPAAAQQEQAAVQEEQAAVQEQELAAVQLEQAVVQQKQAAVQEQEEATVQQDLAGVQQEHQGGAQSQTEDSQSDELQLAREQISALQRERDQWQRETIMWRDHCDDLQRDNCAMHRELMSNQLRQEEEELQELTALKEHAHAMKVELLIARAKLKKLDAALKTERADHSESVSMVSDLRRQLADAEEALRKERKAASEASAESTPRWNMKGEVAAHNKRITTKRGHKDEARVLARCMRRDLAALARELHRLRCDTAPLKVDDPSEKGCSGVSHEKDTPPSVPTAVPTPAATPPTTPPPEFEAPPAFPTTPAEQPRDLSNLFDDDPACQGPLPWEIPLDTADGGQQPEMWLPPSSV